LRINNDGQVLEKKNAARQNRPKTVLEDGAFFL